MDNELREYLDAMEQRIQANTQATVGLAEARFGKRLEETEARFGKRLTAEVRTLRADMAEMGNEVRTLRADVAAEVRTLRADMKQMEQRLIANIQGRREDIDAAFGDIHSLKRSVKSHSGQIQDHERRIRILEG